MYCYLRFRSHIPRSVVNQESIQPRQDTPPQVGASVEKLIHLALPVRLTHMQNGERGVPELACTYDIHPRGARLLSFRDVKVGDLVTVERGRNKSICKVVWTADPNSPLRGQFTVESIDCNKIPWDDELRKMQEQYLPLVPDGPNKKPSMNRFSRGEQNRRRGPRFHVEGDADLLEIGGRSSVEGRVEQISQHGCLISASDLLVPGTGLRLALNIYDVSVALKGNVKYTAGNRAMGVEFHEIRQGDRPLLDYVLQRVKKRRTGDFADLEVVTEHMAAAAAD
jgi:hypothetical protein